jgi:anti-sigma regulatory factor (Ser/Thr protein kinase)
MRGEGVMSTGETARDGFRHEALFYEGLDDFVARTTPFIREGAARGEPTLVVVAANKIELLRQSLDGDADGVVFADMERVGVNPARIIPAWRAFVREHGGRGVPLRGIGEPIFPGQSPAALTECQRHEALLNVAFATSPSWRLVCPYDTASLADDVIDDALRNHPYVVNGNVHASPTYRGLAACAAPFDAPLPDPPTDVRSLRFDFDTLPSARRLAAMYAEALGFGRGQVGDFALAVHELAANSVVHAGGTGVLRLWSDSEACIAEVADAGRIDEPLVGRIDPTDRAIGGRGLWMVNQLCDLVQIRSRPDGATVRVQLARAA